MSNPDIARGLLAIALTATLGACANLDPETRAGEWHPSGANDTNLAAMVANPTDLQHGVDTAPVDGVQAAAAVGRLRADTVKPLPDSGLAELRLQSAGGSAPAAATGAGGQ